MTILHLNRFRNLLALPPDELQARAQYLRMRAEAQPDDSYDRGALRDAARWVEWCLRKVQEKQ